MSDNNTYPTIGQSWQMVFILLASMLVLAPLLYWLETVLNDELAFLLYYMVCMGLPYLYFSKFRTEQQTISETDFSLPSVKVFLFMAIGTLVLQMGIISPLVGAMPIPPFMEEMFLKMMQQTGIYSFITIIIVAPVLEELIFRGIMLKGLLKQHSPRRAIIMSSFLFGVLHLNPWQFVSAFLLGIFSGWLYYKSGKISLSIGMHVTNNAIAFAGMLLFNPETDLDKTVAESYGGTLNLLLVIAMAIVLLYMSVKVLNSEFGKEKES